MAIQNHSIVLQLKNNAKLIVIIVISKQRHSYKYCQLQIDFASDKNRYVFWLLLPDRPSDCVILSPVFQVVFPNSAEHQFQLGLIKEGEQCVRDN